jgi:Undecaprenyl-phosphate galactose phosphotransferase WbaP
MNSQTEFTSVARKRAVRNPGEFRRPDIYAQNRRQSKIKRVLDVAASVAVSAILAPLILYIFIRIKMSGDGPAIYKHRRVGLDGSEFDCLKFRTMVNNADQALKHVLENDPAAAKEWQENQKLKNDPRVTRFGKFLRKTSLDELPQLWNIFKGEMSLVGPRPIVRDEISKYGNFYPVYISVPPGVTGLWQISGRSSTSYDQRIQLDVEYVKTQSFWQDVKILFQTVPVVLLSKGAC